jgi:hypothetical protein
VNVVDPSSHTGGGTTHFIRVMSEHVKHLLTQFLVEQQRFALSCPEDDVQPNARKGLGHDGAPDVLVLGTPITSNRWPVGPKREMVMPSAPREKPGKTLG